MLGTKHSLAEQISEVTRIDLETLRGTKSAQSVSIAKRMSWAAGRRAKRIEDRAYSLMGLFGISMPMLYGEGSKAFQRLQEEILKTSGDQSIFCWVDPTVGESRHGLLADGPDAFAHAHDYRNYDGFVEQPPFNASSRGLGLSLHLTPDTSPIFVAAFLCPDPNTLDGYLAIYVENLSVGERQYARVRCGELGFLPSLGQLEDIFVRSSFPQWNEWSTVMPLHLFHLASIRSGSDFMYGVIETVSVPFDRSELERRALNLQQPGRKVYSTFKVIKEQGRVSVALLFQRTVDRERVVVLLGAMANFDVGFDLVPCDALPSLEDFEQTFRPRPFGTTISLDHHHVTVE